MRGTFATDSATPEPNSRIVSCDGSPDDGRVGADQAKVDVARGSVALGGGTGSQGGGGGRVGAIGNVSAVLIGMGAGRFASRDAVYAGAESGYAGQGMNGVFVGGRAGRAMTWQGAVAVGYDSGLTDATRTTAPSSYFGLPASVFVGAYSGARGYGGGMRPTMCRTEASLRAGRAARAPDRPTTSSWARASGRSSRTESRTSLWAGRAGTRTLREPATSLWARPAGAR